MFSENKLFLTPSLPPVDSFMVLVITHFRDFVEGQMVGFFATLAGCMYVDEEDSS